jgi:hypothetical protein
MPKIKAILNIVIFLALAALIGMELWTLGRHFLAP